MYQEHFKLREAPFSRLRLIATCWSSGRRQEFSGLALVTPWRGSSYRRMLSSVIKELWKRRICVRIYSPTHRSVWGLST